MKLKKLASEMCIRDRGEPCPVCGSVSHPSPARYLEDGTEASKDKVDRLKAIAVEKAVSYTHLDVYKRQG